MKIKRILKCVCFVIFIFAIPFSIFSQSEKKESQDEITLPDVETSISGNTEKVSSDAVPDFKVVLPSTTAPMPVLPSVQISDTVTAADSVLPVENTEKNDVSLEGKLGAGWPGYFIGDFSVYQNTGNSPFSVSFSHEALNGYGQHKPENGYSSSETSLIAIKRFVPSDSSSIDVNAGYAASTYGLQNKSPVFHSVSRQRFVGSGILNLSLPKGFGIGGGVNGDWFYNYGVVSGKLSNDISASQTFFTAEPNFYLSWLYGSFNIKISGAYDFTGLWNSSSSSSSRGVFMADAVWVLEPSSETSILSKLRIQADCDVVISDNRAIVPFSGGVVADVVVPFSTSVMILEAAGGIKSQQTPLADLQTKYPYAVFNCLPVEESDGFTDITIRVPFGTISATTLKLNYAQTVWGNGIIRPDFTAQSTDTGLFPVRCYERTKFASDLGADFQLGLLGIGAGWQASWLDRVEGESMHSVYADFSVRSQNGRWGCSVDAVFNFTGDYTPEIGISAFYRINNSFSLDLEMSDVIKLVTAQDRTSFSPYISHGGIAALTIELFF